MFYQLKDYINRLSFLFGCQEILNTPPVTLYPDSEILLVSQLRRSDVLMYLLAIKSFLQQIKIKDIYIISDDLTSGDIKLIDKHVPRINLIDVKSLRNSCCPMGGTWERLLAISELVKKGYVIQLDSDTLTLGPLSEVSKCIENNTAFTIGSEDNQRIETMEERHEQAKLYDKIKSTRYVQLLAEKNLNKLSDFKQLKYVRGVSAFAGFPKDSFKRDFIEKISMEMYAIVGSKWNEWGSESVMSNIVVTNISNSMVLPHPKYCSSEKVISGETAFIHFRGTYRFEKGLYVKFGKKIIKQIKDTQTNK